MINYFSSFQTEKIDELLRFLTLGTNARTKTDHTVEIEQVIELENEVLAGRMALDSCEGLAPAKFDNFVMQAEEL